MLVCSMNFDSYTNRTSALSFALLNRSAIGLKNLRVVLKTIRTRVFIVVVVVVAAVVVVVVVVAVAVVVVAVAAAAAAAAGFC